MNIYVGNLSYDTTDDSLNSAFAAHGAVDSAKVIIDRESGRSRGFGFVEMSDNDEAGNAISALSGTMLDGREISANEARERQPRGDSGGGGGGGGGRDRW